MRRYFWLAAVVVSVSTAAVTNSNHLGAFDVFCWAEGHDMRVLNFTHMSVGKCAEAGGLYTFDFEKRKYVKVEKLCVKEM